METSFSESEVALVTPVSLAASSDCEQVLRAAYCPPLDDALFYAIASEYELPQDREKFVDVLDSLKAGAIEQENTEFDPSGTGAPGHAQTDTSRSSPEDTLSNGVTSITTALSDLRWRDEEGLDHGLDNASLERKNAWLHHVFPDIPQRDLASVLESCEGSLDKATDELLNLSFLNQGYEEQSEEGPVLKGTDGFAEELQNDRKGRRRKCRTNESSRASSASLCPYKTEPIPRNVWSSMSEDVEFICSRTSLLPQTVRSVYHANGARLSTTIRALALKEGSAYDTISEQDSVLDLQVAEFQGQFERVPKSQIYGLLRLARNMPSAAQELLEAMIATGEVHKSGKLYDAAHYAPIDLKENQPFETPSSPAWTTIRNNPRASAAGYRNAANQSFEQAAAAYKKSKSDRLYGGVAAYHSEIGRERAKVAKELQAAEADALVAGQSSTSVLDLHGVTVQDAVRIASTKTQTWWDGLGDAKYATGGGGPARVGFRIVTGVGSHSKNHAPRIGPAVSRMLIREGWKIEIGHGELIVTGKSRRG